MSQSAFNWQELITPTLNAFKTYWKAIALIQVFALIAVVGNYEIDGVATWFSWIAEWKKHGGLWFSAITTVISGGLIPEAVKRALRASGSRAPAGAEFAHQLVFWALIGMLVDLFYQFQALLFGHSTAASTLACKVLFDQLVFTPLISMPFTVLWFMLWESRYRKAQFLKAFSWPVLLRRTLELWTVCLSFWPVMLLIVYSLPQVLQFPLFLFGNAAYSILMIFIVRRQKV